MGNLWKFISIRLYQSQFVRSSVCCALPRRVVSSTCTCLYAHVHCKCEHIRLRLEQYDFHALNLYELEF